HDGYHTDTTGKLDDPHGSESKNDNNVALTDIGVDFVWDKLDGTFTPTTKPAFEGNQPDQDTGDFTAAKGAALAITPADSTEVFDSMTLDYSDTHGHMVLSTESGSITLAPNAKITFTYGDKDNPTQITKAECNGQTLSIPNKTLAELTSNGLRYVPDTGDNDDADVKVSITAETRETTIGTKGTWSEDTTIVVDAVADQPQGVSTSFTAPGSKNNTVIVNDKTGVDVFDLNLKATFGDYGDGSEAHYFFISTQYISSVSNLPPELSLVDATTAAQLVSDAGLTGSYLVLKVDDSLIASTNGAVDVALKAHLDLKGLPAGDQTINIDVKAGAIEYQGVNTPENTDLGNGRGEESSAANNVSLVDAGFDLSYAQLENKFEVDVVEAWEGDASGQHTGDYSPAGGAVINFAPQDKSEVFDSLQVQYDDTQGSLYLDLSSKEYGNTRVELSNGANIAFTYRNNDSGATLCTVVIIDGTTYTLTSPIALHDLMGGNRLHYIPDATSQDDADVTIKFSGTSRETATDESGTFTHDVLVKVDAVADKPEDGKADAANRNPAYTALDPAKAFDITVDAKFGSDLTDGSEKHYVFVSRDYLDSLSVPSSLNGKVQLLSDINADAVCQQVDGA
ncbi:MAG: hypothetical protein K2O70_01350, partial [Desulfovibrionaceae bacterium]|nr:hypothetical protein [Desulfovibrionaceae bacterium]